jgi:predicted TIM-barrel fold metal-dependent hydrolase
MADAHFPPTDATDCHVHVIGPKTRFPLAPNHHYTPKDALADELVAMLKRLGLSRVVLVQPSFYGTDNACMLDAMAQIGSARGVAVLPPAVPRAELDGLHSRGIRGLRVNIASAGAAPVDAVRDGIETAARLCAVHGWHVQVFVDAGVIAPLASYIRELPVDTVFDHFGLLQPGAPGEALRALQGLLETGKAWVKVSGAYRISDDASDRRIDTLARALCAANPERIVWGSDWPHTPKHDIHTGSDTELPFRAVNTHGLLDLLPRWLEDNALIRRVLVNNPARLYEF